MLSDRKKTKAQLINELESARAQIAELRSCKQSSDCALSEISLKRISHFKENGKSSEFLPDSHEWGKIWNGLAQIGLVLSPDGIIIFANDYLLELTGWTRAEIVGRDWFRIFLAKDIRERVRERFVESMNQYYAHGYSYENEIICRNKELRNVSWVNLPTLDPEGRILYTTSIGLDLTERILAEENIRASEERFRKLIDDVEMVAVQGYNDKRQVIFWNKASENLYGYSRKEAMGHKLENLIIPEVMRSAVIDNVSAWHNNDIPIPAGELELRHKSGTPVSVYSSHAMQRNISGKKEMYCIDVDLSEIKKAYRQLVKAKELAEAANHAKSEFLANMSHEIRTPLNGIIGMLQLLQASQLGHEQIKFIEMAILASRRLTRLLTDILDLSRVEAGKLSLRSEQFNLLDLLKEVVDLFRPIAKRNGVHLDLFIDGAIDSYVVGDSTRLQQVLTNLLGNSFKFTSSGVVALEVFPLPMITVRQSRVLFIISDTGAGIEDDKLDELFTSFTQGSGGYRRQYQGAGLGLSICKQLAKLMDGSIAIESELGKGTSVYFCAVFGEAERALSDAVKKSIIPDISIEKLRVLLAEDETISRIAATKQIELTGCIVRAVKDGKEVLDALMTDEYDLVLMDIQMPNLDGLEATRAIRKGVAGERCKHIPIVAMTAYAMNGDKEKFIEDGMDDYLSKPIDKEELRAVLNKVRSLN